MATKAVAGLLRLPQRHSCKNLPNFLGAAGAREVPYVELGRRDVYG